MEKPNNHSEQLQKLIDEYFEFKNVKDLRNDLLEISIAALQVVDGSGQCNYFMYQVKMLIDFLEQLEACKTPEEHTLKVA